MHCIVYTSQRIQNHTDGQDQREESELNVDRLMGDSGSCYRRLTKKTMSCIECKRSIFYNESNAFDHTVLENWHHARFIIHQVSEKDK